MLEDADAGADAGADVDRADDDAVLPAWEELLPADDDDAPLLLLFLAPAPMLLLLPLPPLAIRSAVDNNASTPGNGYK